MPSSGVIPGPRTHGLRLALTGCLPFFLWLELGYATTLRLVSNLPWEKAVWQAVICILVIPFMLAFVLHVSSLMRRPLYLSEITDRMLYFLSTSIQLSLPWIGWSTIMRLLNLTAITWEQAFWSGAAITVFSYLSSAALILIFHPRPSDVEVSYLETPIPGLPEQFDGYQILHLSDLHAGRTLPESELRRRLSALGILIPDLIVIGGDLALSKNHLEGAVSAISSLQARDGIVAVLGNHDLRVGEKFVRKALARHGVQLLVNEHHTIKREGVRLSLAGVDDSSYIPRDDLAAAFEGIPANEPVILLSHAPHIIRQPLAARAALVLSGHTHGGQVTLPWIGPLFVPGGLGRKYANGLYQINGRLLFVNRGLGELLPPIRIACPPEIAVLTLRRVDSQS